MVFVSFEPEIPDNNNAFCSAFESPKQSARLNFRCILLFSS